MLPHTGLTIAIIFTTFQRRIKINNYHQHSRNYKQTMMETQDYLFLGYLFSQGSLTLNLCTLVLCAQILVDKCLNHKMVFRIQKITLFSDIKLAITSNI